MEERERERELERVGERRRQARIETLIRIREK